MGPTEEVDDRLWIMARGYDGRLYLTDNPHTLHGRMGAWFAADDVHVSLSTGDVHHSSDEAAAWMKGFLAGNEPDADEMLGRPFTMLLTTTRGGTSGEMLGDSRLTGDWTDKRWSKGDRDISSDDVETLSHRLWDRSGREVTVSFTGDPALPWAVMVEGDRGSWSGRSAVEALRNRPEGGEPDGTHGWGVDAQ